MITVLYFARLREAVGRGSEQIVLPAGVSSVGALRDHLAARGDAGASALTGPTVRVAVNQVMAGPATPIADGDEIAFFPPVTGG
jgi:sulfur-carrier protein